MFKGSPWESQARQSILHGEFQTTEGKKKLFKTKQQGEKKEKQKQGE